MADPARTDAFRRPARAPTRRVSWSSWSGRRRASWRPRLKSWPSMPAIRRQIERADIVKLVGGGRVETIWKALDAATTGQARVALEHLDNLLAAGEQPTPMLAAMSANLLKIHHAGRLRAARLNLDEACRIAGIPAFAVDKTRKQHAHLGPQSRRSAPGHAPEGRPRPQRGQLARPPDRSWRSSWCAQPAAHRLRASVAAFFCTTCEQSTAPQ